MLKANGLYGYIQNNNAKSIALVAGFLAIIQIMAAAIWALIELFVKIPTTYIDYFQRVVGATAMTAIPVLCGSIVWVVVALAYSTKIIRGLTGMKPTNRFVEPRLFNLVENLAISCGMPTPQIEISETMSRNAFATGLSAETAIIGVTRGLLNTLNDRELEAVLAHEVTHIRTKDVRLMTIATILCGVIFFIGWILTYRLREISRNYKAGTLALDRGLLQIFIFAGVFVSLLINRGSVEVLSVGLATSAALVLLTLVSAQALRFAVSRTREFVADAGAVELTKNPEALISALIKVEGRNLMPDSDAMLRAMMISAPTQGYFATHPGLDFRIDAIVFYAAQRLNGLRLAPASQRVLPSAFAGDEASAGFSIANMRYPAWISKSFIVLPALVTGLLIFDFMRVGFAGMFDQILALPNATTDLFTARPTGGVFRSTAAHPETADDGYIANFGLGEAKYMILQALIFAPLVIGSRVLLKRGVGTNSTFLRKMAGMPSQEMESDWEDQEAPKLNKLYAKMDTYAAQFNAPAPAPAQSRPATPNNGPVVFGKRKF
jgi:heat shock protein HtpX